jgi:hypothetical protein
MAFSPLSFSRRHVLGDIYLKCEPLTVDVPVYLMGDENELIGHANESLGHYADALTFHLADDVCKKLSAGQYTYEFDLEHASADGRLILRTIFLKARKAYEKPLPARRQLS